MLEAAAKVIIKIFRGCLLVSEGGLRLRIL
jgi:hypothetical protein